MPSSGDTPPPRQHILESHPELVFMRLNGGVPVHASKKQSAGCAERLDILRTHAPATAHACERAFRDFPRKTAARDDILDAAAIAVALTTPANLLTAVPGPVPHDEANLPMQIHY